MRANNALSSFRIFTVTSSTGNLSLFKLTLENGDAENGGAVFVDQSSSLSLTSSKIAFNHASDNGGGIYVAVGGSLSAETSIMSNNFANVSTTPNGGGGGIYLGGSIISLNNSSISHNRAYGMGGGLNNQGSAANIQNSTFSYNLTCFPLHGSGECEVNNNPTGTGGGIYNDASALLLEITQSTFWGNRSYRGGALYNESTNNVVLNNNTISGNFSVMNGGGIYNSPTTSAVIAVFVSNLVAGNKDQFTNISAPDIYNVSPASISTPPFAITPPVAPITEGFNFVGDCGTDAFSNPQCGLTNDVNFDIIGGSASVGENIDPRLKDLAKNGGPTQTVALDQESPALNNGFNNLSLVYDQRGPSFFRTVAQTDIGAYENQYDELFRHQ